MFFVSVTAAVAVVISVMAGFEFLVMVVTSAVMTAGKTRKSSHGEVSTKREESDSKPSACSDHWSLIAICRTPRENDGLGERGSVSLMLPTAGCRERRNQSQVQNFNITAKFLSGILPKSYPRHNDDTMDDC